MITDFVFDSTRLSTLGYTVVRFDGSQDGTIDTDSDISFNHISLMNGKRQPFINSVYESPLVFEFYISKDYCDPSTSLNISVREMADLKRWLIRPTVCNLTIPNAEYSGIYWKGSFNVEEYVFGDKRIGAHLTFECNAPYGYYDPVYMEGTLAANEVLTFNDISDEIGYICPYVHIKMLAAGDLRITDKNGRVTEMKDCTTNELINFTRYLTVHRSNPTKNDKIGDYFNFIFYRISNTYNDRVNTFSCNLPVEYQIVYRPIAKVVPV